MVTLTKALTTPNERVTFAGTVISVKRKVLRPDYHLPLRTTYWALIRTTHGWRVYGCLPLSAIDAKAGDSLILTATVTRKDDEFGFFKNARREHVTNVQAA